MQRNLVLLLLIALFLAVVTAVSQAQTDPPLQLEEDPIIVRPLPQPSTESSSATPQAPMGTLAILTPLSLETEDPPADSCADAPLLVVAPDTNDGASELVGFASEEFTDPVLNCMWGSPASSKGFRTVWYQLVAPVSGRVTISTFSSSFDTVLAVHSGTCDTLVTVACSDDYVGFTSEVTVTIAEGETYYVEVADWNFSSNNPLMNLAVLLQPVDSKWETNSWREAYSHHAVVAQGKDVFIFGGLAGGIGLPGMTNIFRRYDTISGESFDLNGIPGGIGYANSTAALVKGKIYVPGGYSGNNSSYDGKHWVFDIAAAAGRGSWSPVASIDEFDLPNFRNFAWSSAVVPASRDRYYLTGGTTDAERFVPVDPPAEPMKETYVYFPPTDSWDRLTDMQAARYAHTAAWIGTNNLGICVAGGLGWGIDPDTSELATVLHRSAECAQPDGAWHYIDELNIPRYGAGSVVGPDGRWYVFGGLTVDDLGELETVARTEVYDPLLNSWSVLGPSYNLGAFQTLPARYWPRGAMVGNDLWVFGGSIFEESVAQANEQALSIVDHLYIPSETLQIPFVTGGYDEFTRPDDNFSNARPIAIGTQQSWNFDQQLDFVDFFYFDLYASQEITVYLEVPDNNNFDVYLYGQNKTEWGKPGTDTTQGAEESIIQVLAPRRYYIAVTRVFPTEAPDKKAFYTLKVFQS